MDGDIKNGNKDSPISIGPEVLRFVVVGEPRCGKTTFIRSFVRDNFPGEETSINGVRVFFCKFEIGPTLRLIALFEIPSRPAFGEEHREPIYEQADLLIFMYAIDDQSSFSELLSKWTYECKLIVDENVIPCAVVANKRDLRTKQQEMDQFLLEPELKKLILGPWCKYSTCLEVSSNDEYEVLQAFINICGMLHRSETGEE